MKFAKLADMTNGWLIGDFEPSVLKTKEFEVAVQHFALGESVDWHVHKIATEYTIIISGKAEINDQLLADGDIVVLEPGEGAEFRALTQVITAVIKTPSAKGDKYFKGQ